jgi:hypothetical protein
VGAEDCVLLLSLAREAEGTAFTKSPGAILLVLSFALTRAALASSTTVPMQLLGNFPGVEVPLAFDLGDKEALVLRQSVIDRVKTVPTGETHGAKDAMGNVIRFQTFKLPRLQIGDIVFTDVVGRPDVHDPSYLAGIGGDQGHFGTDLLKSYRVVLDYRQRQITLISSDSTKQQSAKCSGIAVPFLPDWNGDPVTRATTDFGERTAVWDSGAPVSILRKADGQKLSDTVVDQTTTTKRLVLSGVDFGPLLLTVANYGEPAGTDMYIGGNFFANHVVCIDFPGKRFLIQQ